MRLDAISLLVVSTAGSWTRYGVGRAPRTGGLGGMGGTGGMGPAALDTAARIGGSAWTVGKAVVGYLSLHTGLPALVIAALLIAIGYRLLRRSARLALEIVAIAATLLVATELGWIRW